jgi:hypothetical protein
MIRITQMHSKYRKPFLSEDQNVEMLTRVLVRDKFSELLSRRLKRSILDDLESVFFNVLYPTYTNKRGEDL